MTINKHDIINGMNSEQYLSMMNHLAEAGKSTGTNQSAAYLHYTKLNAQRMKRLMKTAVLSDPLINQLESIVAPQRWIILTESWCGDAANSIPYFIKMSHIQPQIELQLILRDENPQLMDQFLTNGGRSIPKVIAIDQEGNHLADWGPRPEPAQLIYTEWRNSEIKTPYEEVQISLQKWYNQDKGLTLQAEWSNQLEKISQIRYSH